MQLMSSDHIKQLVFPTSGAPSQVSVLVPFKGHYACRKITGKMSPWIPASFLEGLIDLTGSTSAETQAGTSLLQGLREQIHMQAPKETARLCTVQKSSATFARWLARKMHAGSQE